MIPRKNKKQKARNRVIAIFILLFFVLPLSHCVAVSSLLDGISCIKDPNQNCQLNDLMRVVINVAQFIWGISGSLALLFFIYGGVLFLISAGQTDKINQAKSILVNSVIGLVIIFSSYVIVGFIIQKVLGINANWYNSGWF